MRVLNKPQVLTSRWVPRHFLDFWRFWGRGGRGPRLVFPNNTYGSPPTFRQQRADTWSIFVFYDLVVSYIVLASTTGHFSHLFYVHHVEYLICMFFSLPGGPSQREERTPLSPKRKAVAIRVLISAVENKKIDILCNPQILFKTAVQGGFSLVACHFITQQCFQFWFALVRIAISPRPYPIRKARTPINNFQDFITIGELSVWTAPGFRGMNMWLRSPLTFSAVVHYVKTTALADMPKTNRLPQRAQGLPFHTKRFYVVQKCCGPRGAGITSRKKKLTERAGANLR